MWWLLGYLFIGVLLFRSILRFLAVGRIDIEIVLVSMLMTLVWPSAVFAMLLDAETNLKPHRRINWSWLERWAGIK